MKVCCGIVLYNPSENEVNNVKEKSVVFEKVYIYDNSDNLNSICYDSNNIHAFGESQNKGLSYAYNFLCRIAKNAGYEFIILFDQDSKMTINDINNMINFINNYDDKNKVGIFAPSIEYFDIYKNKLQKEKDFTAVEWCISSGSVINLGIFDAIAYFDINYFIDRVDRDYCKQLTNSGYKIIMVYSVVLEQELGKTRKVFGREYSTHKALRHYYISRNRLYYNHKYEESIVKTVLQVLKHIIKVLFFEENKTLKIKAIILGIQDYKYKKFGKKSLENIYEKI